MKMIQAAAGLNAVGQSPRVMTPDGIGPNMTLLLEVTGGTARTVQFQGAPTRNGPWFNIGTSRTTTGTFSESVPALPFVRVNLSANTGSTVNAWVGA